jgi:L-threonylcarbamoyladenylate synthase
LIAHVHTDYDLSKIIDYDPPYAKKLRDAFLPGPLTLVYPSTDKVSPYVSCGLNTLAVRIPSHEGAQAFLKAVDIPIVAPSANLSKHVSPTSAQHVFEDFDGKIPLILDGGESEGGIESTVCDDLLLPADVLNRMWVIRKQLTDMNSVEAMEKLKTYMERTADNDEFLLAVNGAR